MRLSRTIVYAIHAMLQLAESPSGAAISRGQLAAAGGLPERFLLEVLHSLVSQGLVHSIRGVDGGFVLAVPIEQINMRNVFEAFDFPHRPFVPTIDGQPPAIREQLLAVLGRAHSAANQEIEKLMLGDLRRESQASSINELVLRADTMMQPAGHFATS